MYIYICIKKLYKDNLIEEVKKFIFLCIFGFINLLILGINN
jgi:hypothetical protein